MGRANRRLAWRTRPAAASSGIPTCPSSPNRESPTRWNRPPLTLRRCALRTLPLPWPRTRIPASRPVRATAAGAGQRGHRRLPWCRGALAAGPADLRRRLCVDEHSPPVDDGHDIAFPARKIGPHSHGLAGRMRHDNDDRRSLRDTDHLVRQHVDGLGQRRPERNRHDADSTRVGQLNHEGPGEGAAHRRRSHAWRRNRRARSGPGGHGGGDRRRSRGDEFEGCRDPGGGEGTDAHIAARAREQMPDDGTADRPVRRVERAIPDTAHWRARTWGSARGLQPARALSTFGDGRPRRDDARRGTRLCRGVDPAESLGSAAGLIGTGAFADMRPMVGALSLGSFGSAVTVVPL